LAARVFFTIWLREFANILNRIPSEKGRVGSMRNVQSARALVLAMASAWALDAAAIPLVQMPDKPMAPLIGPEVVPAEIREAFSQQGAASLSKQVLAERSAKLRDAVTADPKDPFLLHALGTVTYHLGGEREAIVLWKNAATRDANLAPPEVMADVHAVFALLAKGQPAAAKTRLDATEKRFAEQPHFQLIRAEQAMRSRNYEEAGRAFSKASTLAPKLYVTALNLGRFREFMQGDATEVMRLYETAARLAPNRAETWYHLGAFQFRQKQPQPAYESFKRLHALDPSSPRPEQRLAELSVGEKDFASAERWYRAALKGKVTPTEAARVNAALGDVLLRQRKVNEARLPIESALKHEEQAPLVFALATIDEAQGKTDVAERRYRRVLELTPNNPLAANNLAMLLIKAGRSTAEALQLAEQARQAIPNNAIIESTFGCALTQSGRHAEAIVALETVQRVTDQDVWSHYCLAVSLQDAKRVTEAQTEFKRVLELEPRFPHRRQIEKLLGSEK
jgi:tetratricopeptide (TPR) repeat protein